MKCKVILKHTGDKSESKLEYCDTLKEAREYLNGYLLENLNSRYHWNNDKNIKDRVNVYHAESGNYLLSLYIERL